MLVNEVKVFVFLYVTTLFGFWMIGAAALQYHVEKYKPSDGVLELFLARLNSPVKELYYSSRYNWFLRLGHKSTLSYLKKPHSLFFTLLGLLAWAIIYCGFWMSFGVTIILHDGLNPISLGWLIVEIASLILACSFGRKLPAMIKQSESEQRVGTENAA
jgi:hypothetical protein